MLKLLKAVFSKKNKGSFVVQMQQEINSKLFPYHCHMNVNLFIKPINLISRVCNKEGMNK